MKKKDSSSAQKSANKQPTNSQPKKEGSTHEEKKKNEHTAGSKQSSKGKGETPVSRKRSGEGTKPVRNVGKPGGSKHSSNSRRKVNPDNRGDDFCKAVVIDKVSDADKYQYVLCSKCWCGIVEDTCGRILANELRHSISTFGLYACIASADDFAKATLSAIDAVELTPYALKMNALWEAVITMCIDGRDTHLESGDLSILFGGDTYIATAACCQLVLRFPKRFTIVKPDTAEAVAKFKAVHQETLRYGRDQYRWPQSTIIEYLRANLREMLIPRNKAKYRKAVEEFEKTSGSFSSGSLYLNQYQCGWNARKGDAQYRCRQCKMGKLTKKCKVCTPAKPEQWEIFSMQTSKDVAVKWGALAMDSDYLYVNYDLYGYYPPITTGRTKYIHYAMKRDGHMPLPYPCYRKRDVLVSAVPKDYETSRMIAPETAFLNVEGGRVRELIITLATLTGAIRQMPPEDQSLNRDRAREGSYYPQDNPYVTIDLSHASDSISRDFFFAIWPLELRAVTRNALSDYMVVDGKLRKVGMLATSGSRLTPILQSCFFLAILWTACDITGQPRDVSVYNDDLICRQSVVEAAYHLLSECGCTVNQKKSFISGPFRESCGGEYLNGFDITGVYWPRHAVKAPTGDTKDLGTLEWLQTMTSLQHKLYSFPSVRQILEEEILSVIPDMTYSPVATECDDLWAKWIDDEKSLHLEHYCIASKQIPRTAYKDKQLQTYADLGCVLNEFYEYVSWLRRGPHYEDAFCERSGISTWTSVHSDTSPRQVLVKNKPLIRPTW